MRGRLSRRECRRRLVTPAGQEHKASLWLDRQFKSFSTSEHPMTLPPCLIPVCRSALFAFLVFSGACVQAQPRADESAAPFAGKPARQTKHQVDTRVFGIVPSHNTLPDLSMV